jgi:colanic acid/amylovoran biosynthesis protein
MKIVITNQVALNVGDAAILRGILVVLKKAFGDAIDVVVLDAYGAAPQRYYPDLTFKQAYRPLRGSLWGALLRRLDFAEIVPRSIAWLAADKRWSGFLPHGLVGNVDEFRSAQLIVSTGGTYLVEHYKIGAPLLQLSAAVLSGTPTIMFTQSLGPFNAVRNRNWLRKIVPALRLVLLRDQRSLDNLRKAGIPTPQARVVADAAFALADVARLSASAMRESSRPLRVAVSVREWMFPNHEKARNAGRNYLATVDAMVRHLVRNENAAVTFISTCQGTPEYQYDDSGVARKIAAIMPEDVRSGVTVDERFHAPEALRDILGEFDLVIATRMHMAILSMCAGTPVLPIAYEFKTKELFDRLHLGEWVLDIDTIEPERGVRTLGNIITSLERVRAEMGQRILQQRDSAFSVAADLAAIPSIKSAQR